MRGAKPGSVASDLVYGITLHTPGPPKESQTYESIRSMMKLTRILETGNGEGKTADLIGAPSAENDAAALVQQRDAFERSARAWFEQVGPNAKDLRGHVPKDDFEGFIRDLNNAMTPTFAAKDPTAFREQMSKEAEKLKWLGDYWRESETIVRSREIWPEFLRRNHLPETRPHDPDVAGVEKALLDELNTGTVKVAWAARTRDLHAAYLKERVRIAATLRSVVDTSNLTPRAGPCPPSATSNTGTIKPQLIGSSRSAEEFWPLESKRLGEEGNVVAGLKISATGCVIAKEIIISSGSDRLDHAALEWVDTVEFAPAAVERKAVESTGQIRIVFKLRDD